MQLKTALYMLRGDAYSFSDIDIWREVLQYAFPDFNCIQEHRKFMLYAYSKGDRIISFV